MHVLLIVCYAEDVRQYWSSDTTPPGMFGGLIRLDMGINALSAETSGSWQLFEPDFTLTALFDEQCKR